MFAKIVRRQRALRARRSFCVAALAAALVLASPASAQNVLDGDTIELNGTTFSLYGIDAPEWRQTCSGGWPAGPEARAYLRDLIGDKEVTCSPITDDRDGEIPAICRADGIDLGAAMVTGGYALAFVPYSARYISQEDAALSARRGMHAHKCVPPWEWRASPVR